MGFIGHGKGLDFISKLHVSQTTHSLFCRIRTVTELLLYILLCICIYIYIYTCVHICIYVEYLYICRYMYQLTQIT